jgi:hypothetical protein
MELTIWVSEGVSSKPLTLDLSEVNVTKED